MTCGVPPQVITGAFKLAYHRGHYYRQPGNEKYMLRFYNLEVTIQGLSKLELLLISHCNCSRFFIICRHQSQQANDHSTHTRSLPSAELLCEDGTTISDSQERKEWMEQQRVAAIISLKTMHPFNH